METVLGLVVLAVIIAVVRSAWRSDGSGSAARPLPPATGPHLRQPSGPRPPLTPGRMAEFPPESTDDAFAVGYLIGREHGRDDAERSAAVDDAAYDPVYDGDDAGWGDDGGEM